MKKKVSVLICSGGRMSGLSPRRMQTLDGVLIVSLALNYDDEKCRPLVAFCTN